MAKDLSAWPWNPESLVVDTRIEWTSVPASAMESLTPRLVKKLKRDDLLRIVSDPTLAYLKRALPEPILAGILNTIAGKAFSTSTNTPSTLSTSTTSTPSTSTSTTSTQDPSCQISSSGLESSSSSPSSLGSSSETNSQPPVTSPLTPPRAIETPEDVLRELESIARNAESESEYTAQIAALKLIGEQMAMFAKNKPVDPVVTINVVTGVNRV